MNTNKQIYAQGLCVRRWMSGASLALTLLTLPFCALPGVPRVWWIGYVAVVVALTVTSHMVQTTTTSLLLERRTQVATILPGLERRMRRRLEVY